MLRNIELTRFKCFASQRIALAPTTILTGLNGMGKSSVIQALLLLRQSAQSGTLFAEEGGLLLNGELVRLGTGGEVLYGGAEEDNLSIGIEYVTDSFSWSFQAPANADLLPRLGGSNERPTASFFPARSFFDDNWHYLGAERVGPRVVHQLSSSHIDQQDLGADGSLAVAFLDAYGDQPVLVALRHTSSPAGTLLSQVSTWLGEISPGVRLETQALRDISLARLSFSFVTDGVVSRAFRPTSVGFGLSYTLPVVVALLAATPGSLIIIENPEAHLHPRGQMAMGDLIARAGAAGVQVIVETHSDHVLNGVRIAVKEKRTAPENVAFHYFRRATHTGGFEKRIVHVVDSPRIDADGRINDWPDGFFDQYDIALEKLL